jgi:hypothetical protein
MKTAGPGYDETTFINVDLDIWAAHDLAPLVEAIGPRVSDLWTGAAEVEEGAFQTHLELAIEERNPWSPDAAIRAFVGLIDGLSPSARRLWDEANVRNFDIGIQGGVTPRAFQFSLSPDTLAAASRLKASVALTVYAVDVAYLQRQQRRRAKGVPG